MGVGFHWKARQLTQLPCKLCHPGPREGGVGGEGVSVTRMSTAHESHEAHQQHVDPEAKQDALKRLNYIEAATWTASGGWWSRTSTASTF